MQKINKDYSKIPSDLANCKNKTVQAIQKVHFENTKYVYEGYNTKMVKAQLSILYNNKCAFCETNPVVSNYLEVEHFRPKGNIKDEPEHKGYYWLAFEWTNFLYACRKCNGSKANQFPIAGTRQFSHAQNEKGEILFANFKANSSELLAEKPLILNPEYENFNPEEHFKFLTNGKLKALTKQAETTINVCDLNRDELVIVRKEIIDYSLFHIAQFLDDYKEKRIDFDYLKISILRWFAELNDGIQKNTKYTLLLKKLFSDFENLIINRLPNFKDDLIIIYNELKNKKNS